jgi:hypothetical protein
MRLAPLVVLILLSGLGGVAQADQEASNIPHVQSSTYGRCYAKSVPDDYWGEKGITRLYGAEPERDRLIATYPWFSQQLYLQCNMSRNARIGASLVRFGPWSRGHEASAGDLALAFYFDGELLARYSTLDIAGRPENVEMSVSHYVVIREVIGYRWVNSNAYAFDIVTIDGKTLSFDPITGAFLGDSR